MIEADSVWCESSSARRSRAMMASASATSRAARSANHCMGRCAKREAAAAVTSGATTGKGRIPGPNSGGDDVTAGGRRRVVDELPPALVTPLTPLALGLLLPGPPGSPPTPPLATLPFSSTRPSGDEPFQLTGSWPVSPAAAPGPEVLPAAVGPAAV